MQLLQLIIFLIAFNVKHRYQSNGYCGDDKKKPTEGYGCCSNYKMVDGICEACQPGFLEPIVLSSVLSLPLDCNAWTNVNVANQNVIQSLVVGSTVTCSFLSDACWLLNSPDKSSTETTIATYNLNSEANVFRTGNHDTTIVIRHTKITQCLKSSLSTTVVPTDDFASDVPGSGIASNNNIILIVGGVIGLFLGILVLQMCVKLIMSREKKNKRECLKRYSEKVKEETYEEISEAMIPSIREGEDELGNLGEVKKYYELKYVNPDTERMSYQKLGTGLKQKDLGSSDKDLTSASSCSDSTNSSDSYLNPAAIRIELQNYLDDVDSTKEQDESAVHSQKDVTGELRHQSVY